MATEVHRYALLITGFLVGVKTTQSMG